MSETTQPGGGEQQPREHPQDPSEGARGEQAPDPQAHSQDPAEGGDDSSATD
jgi:hypothetical protein